MERHRQQFFLDGPNDIDFIFSNDLIRDREAALYVDLIDNEGTLGWDGEANKEHWCVDWKARTVDALDSYARTTTQDLPTAGTPSLPRSGTCGPCR